MVKDKSDILGGRVHTNANLCTLVPMPLDQTPTETNLRPQQSLIKGFHHPQGRFVRIEIPLLHHRGAVVLALQDLQMLKDFRRREGRVNR